VVEHVWSHACHNVWSCGGCCRLAPGLLPQACGVQQFVQYQWGRSVLVAVISCVRVLVLLFL
jgi:hypothetical protein